MSIFCRTRYSLLSAFLSEKGGRPVNEDTVGLFKNDERECFIVCDGLGGHLKGDAASKCVVESFRQAFEASDEKSSDLNAFLSETFDRAQKDLRELQKTEHKVNAMLTTAAVLLTGRDRILIGHVGDSRVYLFGSGKVLTRTLDHSVPQMLVKAGEIDESEIRGHRDRNRLMRVMGTDWEDPAYETAGPIPIKKYQAFLLCSDGFWELITEEQMCRLLKESSGAGDWLSKMADIVRSNGENKNMDNYSAIAVWVTRHK